jgi:hypothetical protein
MKKIICFSLFCAFGSAYGQNLDYTTLTSTKNISTVDSFIQQKEFALLNSISNHSLVGFISSGFTSPQNKLTKQSNFFQNPSIGSINFSSQQRLQYGIGITVEPTSLDYFSVQKNESDELKQHINTNAFLNYQVNPNFALTSKVTVSNANETSFQFSAGGSASKVFHRDHRLTAMLNINWTNQSNNSFGYWHQNERQIQQPIDRFGGNLAKTELRIGASWNWNIDTNWSLTTGATMKHTINSTTKNPFSPNPVTIFSVATYRF